MGNIQGVDDSKMIVEVDIVDKKSVNRFFTLIARLTFVELKQTFSITLIFYHFDPKYLICIETNLSSYAMSRIFSQLISNGSGQ